MSTSDPARSWAIRASVAAPRAESGLTGGIGSLLRGPRLHRSLEFGPALRNALRVHPAPVGRLAPLLDSVPPVVPSLGCFKLWSLGSLIANRECLTTTVPPVLLGIVGAMQATVHLPLCCLPPCARALSGRVGDRRVPLAVEPAVVNPDRAERVSQLAHS